MRVFGAAETTLSIEGNRQLLELASRHVSSDELEALAERVSRDRNVLSVRVELRTLLSVGVALVGTGIALLIKQHVGDPRLVVTLATLLGGFALLAYAVPRHPRSSTNDGPSLVVTICLGLGVVLLTGFVAAVQTFYAWSNLTNLAAALAFGALAVHCVSRVVLASAAALLAAYIGAHSVPMNWNLVELVVETWSSWIFVGILSALAFAFNAGMGRRGFAVVLLDIAVPVALATQNLAMFHAGDQDALGRALVHFVVLVAFAWLVLILAARWAVIRLALECIVSLLVGFMTIVYLVLLESAMGTVARELAFWAVLAVAAAVAMLSAVRINRRAQREPPSG